MKMSLLALVVLCLTPAAFASSREDQLKEFFFRSPQVQNAIKGLDLRGSLGVVALSTDPDACNILASYLVVQAVSESDSAGFESVAAIVDTQENICVDEPVLRALSVKLVKLK